MKIRYRVWSSKEKKMYIPDETDGWSSFDLSADGDFYFKYEYQPGNTAMLSTGLKDCEGREIFEGDILETANNLRAPVEFINGAFYFGPWIIACLARRDNKLVYYRIIGNIYENPELLEDI